MSKMCSDLPSLVSRIAYRVSRIACCVLRVAVLFETFSDGMKTRNKICVQKY